MNNKIVKLVLCMIVMSAVIGCTSEKKVEVKVSPTFKSENVTLHGVQGRIGILGDDFKANSPNKYMWHFWGTSEELERKPFKVEGIDVKTGEKHPVLLEGSGTPNQKSVWEYSGLAGPNNGADAHTPSSLSFPHAGLWRLDAYLGGILFGSVVIEVK